MKNITYKMVQWSTPEELHSECIEWISQLEFIKDEQYFLDELIKDYTIPLISEEVYNESLKLVGALNTEEKELEKLVERVKNHSNKIEVLFDISIDKREGLAFKETHYYLKISIYNYTKKYRELKNSLFSKIKQIMIRNKPKYLSK